MLKGIIGILLFAFFVLVFVLMLTGGYIIRTIKRLHNEALQAAERQERQHRDETGRQRQQYQYTHQRSATGQQSHRRHTRSQQATGSYGQQSRSHQEQSQARHTYTPTGETIIDHHHQERGNRKIFDDTDGEYVDFVEEN